MAELINPRSKYGTGSVRGPWHPALANPQARSSDAAPPLTIGAAYFDDFDDFDSPTGNNSVAGRTGWTLSGGSVLYTDDTMAATAGDGVLIGPHYNNATGLFGSLCDGAHEVRMTVRKGDPDKYEDIPWQTGYHKYHLWYDADSFITLELDPANSRIVMRTQDDGINGGSETLRVTFGKQSPGGLVLPTQGELILQIDAANAMRAYLDKVPLKPSVNYDTASLFDLSAWIGSGHRKGQAGVWAQTLGWPLMSAIGVRTGAKIIHDEANSHRAAAHSVIGGTTGQPTIAADYTGTPVQWIFRIWQATDPHTLNTSFPGANAEGWRAITPESDSAGHVVLKPVLPTGNWIVEYGFTLADGTYVSTYAHSILIAKMIVYYGQSLAALRMAAPTTGIVGDPLGGVNGQAYWPSARAGFPVDYIVNGADTVGYSGAYGTWHTTNAVIALTGEPCIAVALGTGGQNLWYLSNGQAGYDAFMTVMDTLPGVPEAVYLDHGEATVASVSTASEIPTYAANLISGIMSPMRTKWGAGLKFFICIQGKFADANPPGDWSGDWTAFNAAVDALRLVQAGLCTEYGGSDPLVHIGGFRVQIDHGDAYHCSNDTDGNPKLCERDAFSIAKQLYGEAVHDSAGPRITGVSRSGAIITAALDMNGAVALTTANYVSSLTLPNRTGTVWGWFVAKESAPTIPLTISSLDVSGDGESIEITLSADPGEACRVYLWSGGQWDDQDAICGAYSGEDYDRPIPIQPSLDVANGRAYFVTAS